MGIKLSECQQFLDVDDMKFMAMDEYDVCNGCYFENGPVNNCIKYFHSSCIGEYRHDSRNIIWLRIL